MADYTEAFKKGRDEAIKIQAAKNEVAAVLQEFERQLDELGEKKLRVELAQSSSSEAMIQRALGHTALLQKPVPREFDIVVRNPTLSAQPSRTIGRWQPSLFGYPVKVTWDDEDRLCNDKESLETALADMIANPSIAEQLLITMNQREPPRPPPVASEIKTEPKT